MVDINQKASDAARRVALCVKEDLERKPSTLLDSRELQTLLERWRLRNEQLSKLLEDLKDNLWFPEELWDVLTSSSSLLRENRFDENLDSITEVSHKIEAEQARLDEDWGLEVDALLRRQLDGQKSLSGLKSIMISFSEKIDNIAELLRKLEILRSLLETSSENIGDKDLVAILVGLQEAIKAENVGDLHSTLSTLPKRLDDWATAKVKLFEDVDRRLKRMFDDFEELLDRSEIGRDELPSYEPQLFRTVPFGRTSQTWRI